MRKSDPHISRIAANMHKRPDLCVVGHACVFDQRIASPHPVADSCIDERRVRPDLAAAADARSPLQQRTGPERRVAADGYADVDIGSRWVAHRDARAHQLAQDALAHHRRRLGKLGAIVDTPGLALVVGDDRHRRA